MFAIFVSLYLTFFTENFDLQLLFIFTDEVITYEAKGEVSMTVFTPVIAVMYVIVSCLALLLVFGFITETGTDRKRNKLKNNKKFNFICKMQMNF